MNRLPINRLVTGPPPGEARVFYSNIWFRGHNNPRYEVLLPKLSRLDCFLISCSDRRLLRGLQFRTLRATRRLREPLLLRMAGKRYQWMFTTDLDQIQYFRGKVVADVDDPKFSDREVALLNRPNLAAYVVTAERAAARFMELGVRKPYHVVPQGVSLSSVSARDVDHVANLHRVPGQLVIGYIAAWLLAKGDRDGHNPLYNVEHLLELWDEIHGQARNTRLWLIGQPSDRIRRRCQGRSDIVLFGRLPRQRVLPHVANFDLALYPRSVDQGVQAVKVAEYIGLGIPTVSYELQVTEILRETGAGVCVRTPRDFAEAVVQLTLDEAARNRIAQKAKSAGKALDWDVLAQRYENEVLNRYLCPSVGHGETASKSLQAKSQLSGDGGTG